MGRFRAQLWWSCCLKGASLRMGQACQHSNEQQYTNAFIHYAVLGHAMLCCDKPRCDVLCCVVLTCRPSGVQKLLLVNGVKGEGMPNSLTRASMLQYCNNRQHTGHAAHQVSAQILHFDCYGRWLRLTGVWVYLLMALWSVSRHPRWLGTEWLIV
jgi:hypothetical protein